jgi:hypothetical protein
VPKDTFLVLEDNGAAAASLLRLERREGLHTDDAPLDVAAYVIAGDKNSRLYKRRV